MTVINKLKEAGVNTESIKTKDESIVNIFEGMKIVLTGTLPTLKEMMQRND
ncbi:hypothetical protein Q5M85_07330 [Paraclostridium bifermentans]|nr:hypothetical protein [Paraclostridium bifermentans]